MAAVQSKVVVQTKDINNLPASIGQDVLTTSGLLADIQTWAAGYLPLLDAVVGSQILDANIVIPVPLPGGLKSAPLAGNNQMIGGLVRWITSALPWTNEYFGFANAAFQAPPNADLVNLGTGAPFTLLEAYLLTATGTTTGVSPEGAALASILYAIKNGRKNRRGLERRHRK